MAEEKMCRKSEHFCIPNQNIENMSRPYSK